MGCLMLETYFQKNGDVSRYFFTFTEKYFMAYFTIEEFSLDIYLLQGIELIHYETKNFKIHTTGRDNG